MEIETFQKQNTLSKDVIEKYDCAGNIATQTMNYALSLIKPGASVFECITLINRFIIQEVKRFLL
jgi:methionine aminopeptidase